MVIKGVSSKARLPEFKSWLCLFLLSNLWPVPQFPYLEIRSH